MTRLRRLRRFAPSHAKPVWQRLARDGASGLAFSPPGYLGVSASTRSLLGARPGWQWVPLGERDLSTPLRVRGLVKGVAATGASSVVFSGYAPGYDRAIAALRRDRPGLPIRVLWHGSVLQNAEPCNDAALCRIVELAQRGCLDGVGFLKRGMDELLGRTGIPTVWVANAVDRIPERASTAREDGRLHLGLWTAGESWRKNPHAMLAAAALVERAAVSGVLDARARKWARMLGVALDDVHPDPLPHDVLMERLPTLHCNLYVTLSECSPMLPLESLSLGVPCLVSPTSHLFEDAPELRDRLVVDRIDDPHAIAERIRSACAEREAVVEAYRSWAPGYVKRARRTVDAFLGETPR